MPLSNRRKHLLLASVGGVSLILLLILVTRFATRRGEAPSQPSQTSDHQTHIPESSPVNASATAPPTELPAQSDKPVQSPGTPEAEESQPKSPQRIRVPEEVSRKLLISTVFPKYPALARQARIQGTVVLDANISKDGTVETLQVISGHPLLVQAALDSVKQWRYKSYMLNGKPVAVNTQIIVVFTLGG
jgi:TonB family protein